MIAAGGALIISAGGFWYLNGKLDEGVNKINSLEQRFLIQIAKMSQQDDKINVTGSKIKEFEEIVTDLGNVKNDFASLSDELNVEFEKIRQEMTKQDKKIKQLTDKVGSICKSLDIEYETLPTKSPEARLKKKVLKPKTINTAGISKRDTVPPQDIKKMISLNVTNEDDILSQMGSILNTGS